VRGVLGKVSTAAELESVDSLVIEILLTAVGGLDGQSLERG
jgi:hypothetical protein